jgi:hypothetical protein
MARLGITVPNTNTHTDAAVAYVSWDDQWVSYDTDETMATKMSYADQHCLVSTIPCKADMAPNKHAHRAAPWSGR